MKTIGLILMIVSAFVVASATSGEDEDYNITRTRVIIVGTFLFFTGYIICLTWM